MSKHSPVDGWIPVKLNTEDGTNLCRWLYVGDKNFTEPFFDETISACRSLPENGHLKRSMSSTDLLPDWAKEIDSLEPTAFIFHISRCGSTLISQMLGMLPSNIILSEVPFFDDLLRHGKMHNCMPEILPQLQAAIRLYGTKRNENQQQLFIKTDSWHIHFSKELRALYPKVPFFLLYRKPDEVIRSQQKKRGMQAIPNLLEPSIFGFDRDRISRMHLDEYMGIVIESYLTAFLEILQKDKSAYAVNYHDGAMEIADTIAAVTGLHIAEEEKLLMQQRAGFHAKFPEQVFSEEMPDEPAPAYLKRSFELYDKIESVRLGRN
ncbi:MAG: sulfotransferase family protein [Chitinophagaceae bacterium]|nr:sulfotransferase family protein [Chitinophagaceae bacterium]